MARRKTRRAAKRRLTPKARLAKLLRKVKAAKKAVRKHAKRKTAHKRSYHRRPAKRKHARRRKARRDPASYSTLRRHSRRGRSTAVHPWYVMHDPASYRSASRPKKRRGRKLHGAAKKAFLRRMAAGRRRSSRW